MIPTFKSLMSALVQQVADNALTIADRLAPDPARVRSVVFSGGVARRFGMIRERILSRYPGSDVRVAADETMHGLYKYSML